jgi:hypothetical protein
VTGGTGEDDWSERLGSDEWGAVEAFIRKFEMVGRHVDFVEFTVGGESRRFDVNPNSLRLPAKRRGVGFIVPRRSLLTTVAYGYLDDLLIGNFMRVRLINTRLYPRFTPLVAKVGGNAKVYTRAQYRRFVWRYVRRNPLGTLAYRLDIEFNQVFVPWLREAAEQVGIKRPLKYLYRRILGDVARIEKTP